MIPSKRFAQADEDEREALVRQREPGPGWAVPLADVLVIDEELFHQVVYAKSPSHSSRVGAPTQPAAPAKPKPDADGLIWHPHPGYPNQERSEPDAQGRVFYKIHMTTFASQLPPRETDAQRAANLIYRSVIKKYGNP